MERKIDRNGLALLEWVMAGKAVFTILNTATGNRFTYKIGKPKYPDEAKPVQFVSVLTGPDNTTAFSYIGAIFGPLPSPAFRLTGKSTFSDEAPSVIVFKWFFTKLAQGVDLPEQIEVWHEGRCCRCGRRLTVPTSIQNGIGPECADKLD